MKLVAKCLVKTLPYACKNCSVKDDYAKAFNAKLLLPVCLKEYGFEDESLFLLSNELIGGSSLDFLHGQASLLNEIGMDISVKIKRGLEKIETLMRSTGITEFILPQMGTLCGTEFIEDGTFRGGMIKKCGILPTFLKQNRSIYEKY